jgi:adenylate kinase family enzyme
MNKSQYEKIEEKKISLIEENFEIDIDDIKPIIINKNNNLSFLKKGKGRKKKNSNEFCLKSKDSNENIYKKIKSHFLKFLISLLNFLIFDSFGYQKFIFRKLNNSLSKNNIQFNKILFEKTLREILIENISSKFKHIREDENKNVLIELEEYPKFKDIFSFKIKYFYCFYITKKYPKYKNINFQNLLENEKIECNKNNINDENFNIELYLKKFENIGMNFYKNISKSK